MNILLTVALAQGGVGMTANTSPTVGLTAWVVMGHDGRGTEGFECHWRNPKPLVDLVEDCPCLVAYSCRFHVLLLYDCTADLLLVC